MNRGSTGSRPVFSELNAREVIAECLRTMKDEKGYSFSDMGRILGRSEDSAALYCQGLRDLPAFALLAAWREWNGEFISPIRRFVEDSRPTEQGDRKAANSVLRAAAALSDALAKHDAISTEDVRRHRSELEQARDAIEGQLGRLRPEVA